MFCFNLENSLWIPDQMSVSSNLNSPARARLRPTILHFIVVYCLAMIVCRYIPSIHSNQQTVSMGYHQSAKSWRRHHDQHSCHRHHPSLCISHNHLLCISCSYPSSRLHWHYTAYHRLLLQISVWSKLMMLPLCAKVFNYVSIGTGCKWKVLYAAYVSNK